MTDEADGEFVMPPLSQRQREYIYGLLTGQDFYGRQFYGSLHGTLRKNLLDKGLAVPDQDSGWKLELTKFGRRAAEQVREAEIRRAGARLAEEATRTLRKADADMRTPPPARLDYQPAPLASGSFDAIHNRKREIEQVMAWLRDPSRVARIAQLHQCGHWQACANCAELEAMRRELELALISLIGEVDLLKQQLGYSRLDTRRAQSAVRGLIEAQKHLLEAICPSSGIETDAQSGADP